MLLALQGRRTKQQVTRSQSARCGYSYYSPEQDDSRFLQMGFSDNA
jgi:hypothetical protein